MYTNIQYPIEPSFNMSDELPSVIVLERNVSTASELNGYGQI